MIIEKCDLCNREVSIFDTIVLYTKRIDYCRECIKKAEKIKEEYKREIEYNFCILDSSLRGKEKNIISRIKTENNRGIIKKQTTC